GEGDRDGAAGVVEGPERLAPPPRAFRRAPPPHSLREQGGIFSSTGGNPMKRIILAPPVLPAAAVDELKAWLAITNNGEDAALADLLRASLDMCEAFTGRLPISCLCEEVHEVRSGWQALLAEPVISVE